MSKGELDRDTGIRWHRSPFNASWFGLCPTKKMWRLERKRVLKCETHIDMDEYPVSSRHPAMTTLYRTPDPRALVTLVDELDVEPHRLVNLLAHEAYHVAVDIFRHIREDSPGEEVIAYTVGNVTEQLFRDWEHARGSKMRKMAAKAKP